MGAAQAIESFQKLRQFLLIESFQKLRQFPLSRDLEGKVAAQMIDEPAE